MVAMQQNAFSLAGKSAGLVRERNPTLLSADQAIPNLHLTIRDYVRLSAANYVPREKAVHTTAAVRVGRR